jgi:hypothetical protein
MSMGFTAKPFGSAAGGGSVPIEPTDLWPSAGPPVMPEGLLPKRLEDYARASSITIGADEGGFAIAALAVSAAAIDDVIKLQVMPYSKWYEEARIWAAPVGPPSTKKSPIIRAACEGLNREDRVLARRYAAQKAEWDALPKADKAITPAPMRERYTVGDTTSESLQEAFRNTERGLLGLYDELSGFFGQLDRYGSSGHAASERSFMLQTYNGGPYTVDRISRGSFYIPNLSLTVLGGIQPDLIRKQSHAATDDGLIQRLTPIMLRPGWPPRVDANANRAIADYETLIPQLLALEPPEAGSLRFDEGAQAIRDDLAIEHDTLVKECEGFNAKLSTALGKQDGLFARLCVIWHCVEHAGQLGGLPEIITEDTAARVAAFMVEFIRRHLFDFYAGVLELPDEHERLLSIAGYILSRKLSSIANWRLQAAVRSMRKLSSKDITPVLEHLEAFGWLIRGQSPRGGAPPVWTVNSLVHDGRFAKRRDAETMRREKAGELLKKAAAGRRHDRA